MKLTDYQPDLLTLVRKDKDKYMIEYNGDIAPLFLDLPKCVAFQGVKYNRFSQESNNNTHETQVSLKFKKSDPSHMAFIEFFDALNTQMLKLTKHHKMCSPIKPDSFQESVKVMYVRLDSYKGKDGAVVMHTVMENFPSEEAKVDTFVMSGTLKISGVIPSSGGLAYMKRMSKIVYLGLDPGTTKLDVSSNTPVFHGVDITETSAMLDLVKASIDKEDEEDKVNRDPAEDEDLPAAKRACKDDKETKEVA